MIEFRSSVAGNYDHGFDYSYQLNKMYQIEISQSKQGNVVTYKIRINNATVHSVINTQVEIYPMVHIYLR